ncbi:hypothetical protein TV39_04650 [Arthrobacter sp. SPG23]|nr:hypothetical protein TV39_04650 [Arthrobacter sp. SPG23]
MGGGTLIDIYAILAGPLREHVSIARLLKDGSLNLDGEIATTTPTRFHRPAQRRPRGGTPEQHQRVARRTGRRRLAAVVIPDGGRL